MTGYTNVGGSGIALEKIKIELKNGETYAKNGESSLQSGLTYAIFTDESKANELRAAVGTFRRFHFKEVPYSGTPVGSILNGVFHPLFKASPTGVGTAVFPSGDTFRLNYILWQFVNENIVIIQDTTAKKLYITDNAFTSNGSVTYNKDFTLEVLFVPETI